MNKLIVILFFVRLVKCFSSNQIPDNSSTIDKNTQSYEKQGFLKNSKQDDNMYKNNKNISSKVIHKSNDIVDLDKDLQANRDILEKNRVNSNQNKQHFCLSLYNYKNSQFIGKVRIANLIDKNSKQVFHVIFDTGSSYLQLNSKLCTMPLCSMHKKYDSQNSKNFKVIEENISISYGSGQVQGRLSMDDFKISNTIVEGQQFIEIKSTDDAQFSDAKYDGIVGLAFGGLVEGEETTFWDHLIQKREDLYMMMYYLDRQKGKKHSKVCFGTYNSHIEWIQENSLLYKNNRNWDQDKTSDTQASDINLKKYINWSPVVSDSYWQIKLDKVLVGGLDILLCKDGCKAIIDTGSSLISGPSKDIEKLQNIITIDPRCKNADNLPEITFVIGDTNYTLTSDDFIMGKTSSGQPSLYVGGDGELCLLAMNDMDIKKPYGPTWIQGNIFITKFMVFFDRKNKRIGFANRKKLKIGPFKSN